MEPAKKISWTKFFFICCQIFFTYFTKFISAIMLLHFLKKHYKIWNLELAYNLFFHSPIGAQFTHFEYLFHHYIIVFIFFPLQCKRITIILFLHWNVDLKGWFAYFSLVLQIKFSKISVHIDNKRERGDICSRFFKHHYHPDF